MNGLERLGFYPGMLPYQRREWVRDRNMLELNHRERNNRIWWNVMLDKRLCHWSIRIEEKQV